MDTHDEINRTLGQILGEVKGLTTRFDESNDRFSKYDERLEKLEAFKNQSIGKTSVFTIATSAVFTFIGIWISKKLGI